MPATARRSKSEAYEKGIREGTAMAKRSRGNKPTEEEEMDMGMKPGHSRKRRKPAADGYGMKKPMDGGMYGMKKPMDGGMYGKKPMDGGMYGKKPMDAECGCGKKKGRKCDGSCGSMRKRGDSLTPQEYLTACELGIQDRSATYIRARLDAAEARNDLKCGKGAISKGEKCTKGTATRVSPVVRAGQAAKKVGLGALEGAKWVSGYNIGKAIASGVTGGKNEKASGGAKAASVIGSTALLGPYSGLGAARRVGVLGPTDLQQHAKNEKKERKWRKSVGYKDGSPYAKGFKVDYSELGL